MTTKTLLAALSLAVSFPTGAAIFGTTAAADTAQIVQLAESDAIAVEAPFARASAGPVRNGAAFLTLRNGSGEDDRLVAARAPVADRVELHTHLHENGVMRMRQVEAIEVPAGGTAMLKPGGDHVMLMGLKAPLQEGESFPLTLVFEKAGEITVDVTIGGVGAMQGHGGSRHNGGHGNQGTNKSN